MILNAQESEEADGGLLPVHHGATFSSYPRGVCIHQVRDDRTILQPARAESPISHTSAHEMSAEELERIFAAPFTFAACRHYLVKMAS